MLLNRQHHAFWLLTPIRQFQPEVMEDLSKILSLSMIPFPSVVLLTFQTGLTTTTPGLILTTAKITEGGKTHYSMTRQPLDDFSHPDPSAKAPSLWQKTNHPLQ